MKTKLTEKQKMFCKEYIKDLNATQSAIRAGYSEKTAAEIGRQNLMKLEIQAKIKELLNSRSERIKITADDVLKELWRIGTSDITEFLHKAEGETITLEDIKALPPGKRKLIKSIGKTGNGVKIELVDKLKSLELVGRHLGMFSDNLNIRVDQEMPKEDVYIMQDGTVIRFPSK